MQELYAIPAPERQIDAVQSALVVIPSAKESDGLKSLLGKIGIDVLNADNVGSAVEILASLSPRLVFISLDTPTATMDRVIAQIKLVAREQFIPLIMTTTQANEAKLAAVSDAGDDFLLLPTSPAYLQARIQALNKLIDLHEHSRQQRRSMAVMQSRFLKEQEIAERILSHELARSNTGDLPEVRSFLLPAETFSGDLILVATRKNGGLNVLMGDFAGHGLAAAIGAIPVAEVFRAMTFKGVGMLDILREINFRLRSLLPTGMFMCCAMLSFSKDLRSVSVWNGGMPHILLWREGKGNIHRYIKPRHVALGIMDDFEDDQFFEVVPLQDGDRVYVFSDGLIEAENVDAEQFGMDRLMDAIENTDGKTKYDKVTSELRRFIAKAIRLDDISFVEIPCVDSLVDRIQNAQFPCWEERQGDGADQDVQKFSMVIKGSELKDLDPLGVLIKQLDDFRGGSADNEALFTIFSELINNAVDHGVLGLCSEMKTDEEGFAQYFKERQHRLDRLDSGEVVVDICLYPRKNGAYTLEVWLSDSGEGFDYDYLVDNRHKNDTVDSASHGRGIKLLKYLSEELEFFENGTKVYLKYNWA